MDGCGDSHENLGIDRVPHDRKNIGPDVAGIVSDGATSVDARDKYV
jgi:hypothetical protein